LILTNHIKDLELGDARACLKIQNANELFQYFMEKGISEEILRKLCREFDVKVVENEGKLDLTQTLISFFEKLRNLQNDNSNKRRLFERAY